MEMIFAACIILAVLYGGLIYRYRTVLFGLTGLNLFVVASSSLSGFLAATLAGDALNWVTPQHVEVFQYTLLGVGAMIAGLYVAWRPLAVRREASDGHAPLAPHLNERLGWFSFLAGTCFELAYPLVRGVPTLSTAFVSMSTLNRIGLLILLWNALHTGRWRRFGWAMAIFAADCIFVSVMTGFSFIRINTVVPLALVFFFARGVRAGPLLAIPIVGTVMAFGTAAWLDTRDVIRSGSLEHLSAADKVERFVGDYWNALFATGWDSVYNAVFERVDVSDTLALQVAYQPDIEPYAYGGTLASSFYTLIPRALWPGKPEVAGGTEFVEQYTGAFRPVDDGTSIGLPYQFELYANGGPIAVILGLALIGYVGGRLERRMWEGQTSLGAFWSMATAAALLSEGGQRTDVVMPQIVAAMATSYVAGWAIEKYWPDVASRLLTGGTATVDERTTWTGRMRAGVRAVR